ncbi:hypothetical protein CYMTET_26631 [Cymbomonas tetramitiformis]|uniref:Uncharacterized protein n=1 Tax=Cymbomonas tetramitiformis TaxID=36881 RepID=A0AAE0C5V1_9CHLO|nr:hypothetical protein CYMTET_41583 [Cymbomonas tetramitiformis]KAK3264645.1 hypothetical protein CYMTET_26631 [Cymbomonas tetramitiformis]
MVSTRATSSRPARRRNLAAIFDNVAARHAATPATPSSTAAAAANSATALFVAAVRTLRRAHFDEDVAKCVQTNVFGKKEGRFGAGEPDAASLFSRLVEALRDAFVTEDSAFASLFTLDDATIAVRVEVNVLLYSTLELLVDPSSPAQRTGWTVATRLSRWTGNVYFLDSHVACSIPTPRFRPIANFDAVLDVARRRSAVDEEEVKPQFIKALAVEYYLPIMARLLLHDQRVAVDLLTSNNRYGIGLLLGDRLIL